MRKWLLQITPAVFYAFCIIFVFQPDTAWSEQGVAYEITAVDIALSDNTLEYTIAGNAPPAYTVSERFSPFRAVLDVAGAYFAPSINTDIAKIPQNKFAGVTITELKDIAPSILRFEFQIADSHDYSVEKTGQHLHVKVFPAQGNSRNTAASASLATVRALTDFKVSSTPNSTSIAILANGPIDNYIVDTIGSGVNRPPRMYIDIEDVAINELVRETHIGTSVERIRVAPRNNGVRIVFDSAGPELFRYSVAPSPEGLTVVIDETPTGDSIASSMVSTSAAAQSGSTATGTDVTLDQLIGSSEQLLSTNPEEIVQSATAKKVAALQDDFSFSGYKKQRISVDFYKIDIHNVFRLFRQITDLNIIVDEEVQGSLTLALSDVPWDFALDIILNLMDLKKEERFNTVVIYPAKKDFVWPTRAEDNLAFEADVEVIEQEALVIEKTYNQTQEIMQAKKFMVDARGAEERNDFETAAVLYTKALELWPGNAKIANRLSTLYLVNLGMNAKAVFYAKESLKIDPQNTRAALYAAIGSANMQRVAEAKDYFSQAISGTPPMKEALLSYAAFSENNGQNESALKLLEKYHGDFGETLDTMVAKARLLDKMGLSEEAARQYAALLTSGFQLRPDLKRYIEGRLATKSIY